MSILYAVGELDSFKATTWQQAVREYLENTHEPHWPVSVDVEEWEHIAIGNQEFDWMLDRLVDELDDEHGNPDGPTYKPSETAKALYKVFTDQVKNEYPAWQCNTTGLVKTVNIQDFLRDEG